MKLKVGDGIYQPLMSCRLGCGLMKTYKAGSPVQTIKLKQTSILIDDELKKSNQLGKKETATEFYTYFEYCKKCVG